MSTSYSTTELISSFLNPERVIRYHRRSRGEPSLLFDYEEINMNPNNVQGPPPAGPFPQNPTPDLRMMEELCQPTMNGRGGPIAPVNIQATNFGLKNYMIQQVQQSCQYHGLPGDDANKHIDKFLTVTQSMKQNGVPHDILRLCIFPYSLMHRAIAWSDRLPKNSIHSREEMVTKFHSKYSPPSMVTKLRNDISNLRQLPDESLFKAWERYKLLIDRFPNHNMLPITQIDTFYNGLTLRHRDTINAVAGGTFMKRRPKECYDLIKNMTAHHNDWDTSAQRANQMTKIEKTFNERPQGALPSNTIPNHKKDIKEVERDLETTIDQVHISTSESTPRVPSPVIQPALASKSNEILERNPRQPSVPYHSSFAEALAQMPKYAKMLKDLLTNKKKLLELANTPLNENYSADVFVQVSKFMFPADFVIVDYDIDPRVPLILGRPFLRMTRALVDVHGEELILRVSDEKLTFNVDSTLKYSHKHGNESINLIDIIDTTCEDHFYEELKDQKSIHPLSGSPTLSSDPIVAEMSHTILIGDKEIKFNPLKYTDDPVPIPRATEKPLDSLDCISETFVIAITNPLFDFDSEFTSILDNPIFDIQNEDSDESKTKTIMKDVQIHSSQSIAQIPPSYKQLSFDMTKPYLITISLCHFLF
nr:reverse transcriptase domain-containing protein [Tanacetum cinerariifolium]